VVMAIRLGLGTEVSLIPKPYFERAWVRSPLLSIKSIFGSRSDNFFITLNDALEITVLVFSSGQMVISQAVSGSLEQGCRRTFASLDHHPSTYHSCRSNTPSHEKL
jgi:hypothetical protein